MVSISKPYEDLSTQLKFFRNVNNRALIIERDTRSENKTPQEYVDMVLIDNTGVGGMFFEFKELSTYGYASVLTIVPWKDFSGGYPWQLAFTVSNARPLFRKGNGYSSWVGWSEF